MESGPGTDPDNVIAKTRHWLEVAVIGLNLCPFARAVHVRGLIRYVVSDARTGDALLTDLRRELEHLRAANPAEVETTLLIHPWVLGDFADFNAFLDPAEALLSELQLEGEIQLASFHPAYQFAGTEPDDITNCTNRSPYPTLHLLREASISRAIATHPRPEAIYEENQDTLRRMGPEGWRQLGVRP